MVPILEYREYGRSGGSQSRITPTTLGCRVIDTGGHSKRDHNVDDILITEPSVSLANPRLQQDNQLLQESSYKVVALSTPGKTNQQLTVTE